MEICKKRVGVSTLDFRPRLPALPPAPPPLVGRAASGWGLRLCLPLPALPTLPALSRMSLPSLNLRPWRASNKGPLKDAALSQVHLAGEQEAGISADALEQSAPGQNATFVAAAVNKDAVAALAGAEVTGAGSAPTHLETRSVEEAHMIRQLPSPFEAKSQRRFSEDVANR